MDSAEVIQQSLRLLQVRRINPLGEPAIPRGEQDVGILELVLGLSQASARVPNTASGHNIIGSR
jgi:hypothetical protein